ncbi:hypothetical protein ACUXST_000134 [Sphingomonas sp. F9_3S_D5_B_2]
MAYDRYDTRDEHPRWRESRDRPHQSGRGEDKGFFERAGEEIASWFGDDHSDRGRGRHPRMGGDDRHDHDRDQRGWGERRPTEGREYDRGYGRDAGRDRGPGFGERTGRSDYNERYQGTGWPSSERDYNSSWRDELSSSRDEQRHRSGGGHRDHGYRPMTGDYGRSERMFGGGSSQGPGNRDRGDDRHDDRSNWGRDDYRSTSRAGTRDQSDRSRDFDPHYNSWRDQHMSELDRDYHDYRRENQSRFENDFSNWRERRTQKRGLLGQIREHMEVVGSDDEHVGTVDKIAGDRIILTKSDPESGGAHHSISCSHVERIDGDRVVLECSADKARHHWRDETRSRALFEREDQGEMGNHVLNRSFEGTYR